MRARIVIVNWNGRRWLEGCLLALERERRSSIEVVLVDNASTDDSVTLVRGRFPWVRVLALESNTGFAKGNNLGATGASGDYLIFLNNDTVVRSGWLDALLATADGDAAIGLVTSQITYLDRPNVIDSAGDGYLRCGGAFKIRHGQAVANDGMATDVFGACGAACLVRRALFEQVGGFDEHFFMVYEDVDLSYRARLAGARVVYTPRATVYHAGSASLGRSSRDAVFYGQRNLEWTWLQNSPPSVLWRSLLPHVAYSLAAGVVYARRGLFQAWLSGKIAAFSDIRRVLARRRDIQAAATVDGAAIWSVMASGGIALKRREKQFDFTSGRRSAGSDR